MEVTSLRRDLLMCQFGSTEVPPFNNFYIEEVDNPTEPIQDDYINLLPTPEHLVMSTPQPPSSEVPKTDLTKDHLNIIKYPSPMPESSISVKSTVSSITSSSSSSLISSSTLSSTSSSSASVTTPSSLSYLSSPHLSLLSKRMNPSLMHNSKSSFQKNTADTPIQDEPFTVKYRKVQSPLNSFTKYNSFNTPYPHYPNSDEKEQSFNSVRRKTPLFSGNSGAFNDMPERKSARKKDAKRKSKVSIHQLAGFFK